MGTIQRQSLKNTIVSYGGMAIGFLSTIFIYNLDRELYGYAQFLFTSASFLVPFATLGVTTLTIKYYPQLSQKGASAGSFIRMVLLLLVSANLLFLIGFFVFREQFFELLQFMGLDKRGILHDTWMYFLPMALLMGIIQVLTSQSSNLRRIVIPEVMNGLGYKITLPILIFLGYKGLISQNEIALGQVLFYVFLTVGLSIYVRSVGGFKTNSSDPLGITPELKKDMKSYVTYGALTNFGSAFLFRIDVILIALLLDYKQTGTYVIMLFLANAINVPRRAISKIAGPYVAEAWNSSDHPRIQQLFQKSSTILLIAGASLFLVVWTSLGSLDQLSGGDKMFFEYRYVFLVLGVGRLLDLSMSLSTEIIIYSRKYRVLLLLLLLMGTVAAGLNWILIPKYGIFGAALATAISYALFNILKTSVVYISFGMIPFSKKTLTAICFGLICFGVISFVQPDLHPLINILTNVLLVTVLFVLPLHLLKVSADLNRLIQIGIDQLSTYFGFLRKS